MHYVCIPEVLFFPACSQGTPVSQSMNKLHISLFPSVSVPFFLHPFVRVHSRTPHRRNATHHQPREAVNLEKKSGVEQMNSRRGKRISRLLNLAEANASFVEEGIVKQGIPVQRSCLGAKARDHLLMRKGKKNRRILSWSDKVEFRF